MLSARVGDAGRYPDAEPLAAYLEIPLRHVSPTLLDRARADALRGWAATMRGDFHRLSEDRLLIGLEFALDDAYAGCDVSVLVSGTTGSEPMLLRLDAPDSLSVAPQWQRLNRFLAGVHGTRAREGGGIDNVFLEFDLSSGPGNCPNLMFEPRADDRSEASGATVDGRIAIVAQAIEKLGCERLERDALSCLRKTLEACVTVPRMMQIGLMIGRDARAIRLCLPLPSLAGAVSLLERLGCSEHIPALMCLDDTLGSTVSHIVLNLDIGREVLPYAGIELYAGDGRCTAGGPEQMLLDRLADAGLAHAKRCAAILTFAGKDRILDDHDRWPMLMQRAWIESGLERWPTCLRLFHHAKVSLVGRRPPAAKAYLAVLYRHRDRPDDA